MGQINILGREIAEKIAAGEVVERPASVVKELIENAIDAKASSITVEIRDGGISFIRVADNGCGMDKDDAKTAFLRHATSKISNVNDLFSIDTLGFRGEALAAISAVSDIELTTKQKGEIEGFALTISGGNITSESETGCPEGTTMIVKNLFFNTPARMKFLKRDVTEAGYVASVVEHAALSRPDIAFKFIREGKITIQTPGNGDILAACAAVYGTEFAKSLIKAQHSNDRASADGFVARPESAKASRSMQHFFVNGRYIKSAMLSAALLEAYRNRIMTGKYPMCVIYLTVHPSAVDVNVHPAKTEVKFADEKAVFEAVYVAALAALDADDRRMKMDLGENAEPKNDSDSKIAETDAEDTDSIKGFEKNGRQSMEPEAQTHTDPHAAEKPRILFSAIDRGDEILYQKMMYSKSYVTERPRAVIIDADEKWNENERQDGSVPDKKDSLDERMTNAETDIRVVGEAFRTYIIVECGEKVILIDKHAAHERIIFNSLKKEMEEENIAQQVLIAPETVDMPADDAAVIADNIGEIQKLGFDADVFGRASFIVRAVPQIIEAEDVKEIFYDFAQKLREGRSIKSGLYDEMLHSIACKAAIKAGDITTREEIDAFAKTVIGDKDVAYCPHGRPVTVEITKSDLEKQFRRVL